jgi:hypothetical protein
MTLQAPLHSPRTPEQGTPQPPTPLWHKQAQYPAHSPVFPQAPTEPRPAAWVYAARSQAHSVGPTPQDGPRLRREVDGVGSIFFVNGGSTSHVDLARVGRELRLGE